MSRSDFDIIIAGAGMVGACAALRLARDGLRVALIEASEARAFDADGDYDLRVSAISPRSREILERLGVWWQLDQRRVCSYEQMHIWHQHGAASVDFDAVELARGDLGAIVENSLLQDGLHRACARQTEIEWFQPDRVEALLANTEQGVELRLASGRHLGGALLIAADGRNSPTRALAGIEAQSGQYRQTAIVANVTTELPHRHTAWQRFLATGPLAFLPLANGHSAIVWSCDHAAAGALIDADDESFCRALSAAFEYRLGAVSGSSARLSFELGWHRCERWLERRVLVIGDAAHGVHPLAGQGVNLGFSDADMLAGVIAGRIGPGLQPRLRRFERRRKSETWLATQSFGALKWLYGLEQRPVTALRDAGMQLVDKTAWLKRSMMQKAIQNIT